MFWREKAGFDRSDKAETFAKSPLVAPAQAGAQSEATLQLKLTGPENAQPYDLYWISRIRKIDRQAKLGFACPLMV
ncbi:MAG: hypothetical protein Q4G28_04130 [Neisseria sp.]|nr:hypothetical protein [Neisseria sp.]